VQGEFWKLTATLSKGSYLVGRTDMAENQTRRFKKTRGSVWGFFYIPRITRESGIFASDKKDYLFSEFFKILAEEKEMKLPPLVLKHPDEATNEYLKNYGLVVVVRDHAEGNNICFSNSRCNKLPAEFTDRIRNNLKVMQSDVIQWSDDLLKQAQIATVREVIYGEPPPAPPADFDDQLRRLAKLKQEGLISEDEFNLKKRLLLGV